MIIALGRLVGQLLCRLGLHVQVPVRGIAGVTRCARDCGAYGIAGDDA